MMPKAEARTCRRRVELARHVTTIRMMPEADGKKGQAEGECNLLGGFDEG